MWTIVNVSSLLASFIRNNIVVNGMVPYEPVHPSDEIVCPECEVELDTGTIFSRNDCEVECPKCREIIGYSLEKQESIRLRVHEDTAG